MHAKNTDAPALRREIRIRARPETIYRLLTDPAQITRWKGRLALVDARPGGDYRVVLNDNDVMRGKVVEAKPNEKFVFTFGWEGADNPIRPGSTTVEITLVPDGDATIVRLVHTGLPAAAAELHGKGWDLYLGRLAVVAATGGDPGPDPNAGPGRM